MRLWILARGGIVIGSTMGTNAIDVILRLMIKTLKSGFVVFRPLELFFAR